MPAYNTVNSVFSWVAEPIRGSHFAAQISGCTTGDEALAAVSAARAEWSDASHHCWAYRLRGGDSRTADDGEPGGSAGRPILAMIDGHEVVDVVVIVARWYGGTKLGVGGLIRAYGGTAGKALDAAPITETRDVTAVTVVHGYDDTNAVAAVVAGRDLSVVDTTWAGDVTVVLNVDDELLDDVIAELTDRTRGRAHISVE